LTDLSEEATRDIGAALNGLLADVFALYLKTKNFHWHMSGPQRRAISRAASLMSRAIRRASNPHSLALHALPCAFRSATSARQFGATLIESWPIGTDVDLRDLIGSGGVTY
jgi:hypothetical protein